MASSVKWEEWSCLKPFTSYLGRRWHSTIFLNPGAATLADLKKKEKYHLFSCTLVEGVGKCGRETGNCLLPRPTSEAGWGKSLSPP